MNIKKFIEENIINIVEGLGYETQEAFVSTSNRPDLSDYQSNIGMFFAKKYKISPRDFAEKVVAKLKETEFFEKVTVDGPGFINISLASQFLIQDFSCGFKPSKRTVVIDYGGPNIAKEMHVGHLRSGVIGESLKRIMRACGDKVIGDVHFGDWGTPIGMLISQLKREKPELAFFAEPFNQTNFEISISEISALYRRAATAFKEDESFKEEARIATFDLQNGRVGYLALWQLFRDKSVTSVKENYDKLGVDFDLWMGESNVNGLLCFLLDDLTKKGFLVSSEGALIVSLPPKDNRERAPLILKKSDGAYTYAATDLATIIQRQRDFYPQSILYVVDARQREHFEQVFEVAHMAGYVDDTTSLEHIAFGTVNGKDGKPFKTRSGGVMNLKDLIELAVDKAKENVPVDVDEKEASRQAEQIAIGALKYQDLKNSRISDYIFDTENFTKSEGKTGAYVQYAIARINSILDKSGVNDEDIAKAQKFISHPLERDLMLLIARQEEILTEAYIRREPSIISSYVHLLAQKFSSFYAELKINAEEDLSLKLCRLKMISLVRCVLKSGLDLLGIESPERMLIKSKEKE